MICVYPSDCTDFSTNGLAVLAPSSCVVTETLNGEWELTLVHPHDERGKWYHLTEGSILRVPVPAAMTPRVSLVTPSGGGNPVEIYAVNTDSPQASVRGGTLRLRTGPGTEYAVLRQYPNGTQLQVIAKTSASWYEALLPDGKRGYMDARFLSFVRTEGSVQEAVSAVVEARQLRDQPFRVYRVVPELNQTTVYARHIFYDLADNMIQRYVPGASTTGAVVVQQLANSCMSEHPFTFYSDLTGTAEDASFENVNPVEAFLGEGGLTEKYGAELARDWFDVFLVKRAGVDSDVEIRQGKNLLGISYDVDMTQVTTRIMPTGEDRDGNLLYLPELYVDSPEIGSYPRIMWIHLPVSEAKESDSEDEPKTREQCYEEMRKAARAQFEAGCDLPTVTLNVDFINCADTAEYAAYRALTNIYLGDAVRVLAPRIGVAVSMRMTQYTFDCLTGQYTAMTLGTVADTVEGNIISTRQLPSGSITGAKLALNSVGARQLQNGSVGSLQVKNAAIGSAHIQEASIYRAHIAEALIDVLNVNALNAVTAKIQELAAGHITTDELYASIASIACAQLTTANIVNANIQWADIVNLAADIAEISKAQINTANILEANIDWAAITTLSAAVASMVKADIGSADIDFAHVKDLAADTAIITEGVGGQLYIARLAVTEANMVSLTVGELVVKGKDGHFYAVSVDGEGQIVTEQKQISNDDVQDLSINAGEKIIEGTITAGTLNVQNIFADNETIRELIAANINVDTLFARQATIDALNAMDITSNTYLHLMVSGKADQSDVDGLTERMEQAELRITDDAIVSTVTGSKTYQDNQQQVRQELDELRESLAGNEIIVGTMTANTSAWTGVASFGKLRDGQQIAYWLPYSCLATAVTLNLTLSDGTLTGAVPCYYSGLTRITTQYAGGNVLHMVYRENAQIFASTIPRGWWADANYDSSFDDRIRLLGGIKAKTAISASRLIAGDDSGYFVLTGGTTFHVTKPVLWTANAISAGSNGSGVYLAYPTCVLTNNVASFSGTMSSACYLVGTLNGQTFRTAAMPFTTAVPTSEDGLTYLLLGHMSGTVTVSLYPEHPMYRFVNGEFKTLGQVACEAQEAVSALTTELHTSIEQTNAQIELKADKSVTDALDRQVQAAQSQLTTQAGQIAAVVTQSQTTTDNLAQLTIGGRNYLLNSDRTLEMNNPTSEYANVWLTPYPTMSERFLTDCRGKTVTMSLYAMCQNLSRKSSGGWIGIQITLATGDGSGTAYLMHMIATQLDSGTKPWGRYVTQVKVPEDAVSVTNVVVTIQGCTGIIQLRSFQVELGNRETDYRPAPEDLETRVTTAESRITQQANQIGMCVTETVYNREKVYQGVTAPASPGAGTLWLDTSQSPHMMKRYNGVSWQSVGADQVKTSGIYIGPDSIRMTTENFLLQLLDPANNENVLMEMSANGHVGFKELYATKIISNSVAPAYDGPSNVTVNPNAIGVSTYYYRSLSEAAAALNGRYLPFDVRINFPTSGSIFDPSGVTFEGISGPGSLRINGNANCPLISYVTVKGNMAQIVFQNVTFRESRPLNGSAKNSMLVYCLTNHFVQFEACVFDANNTTGTALMGYYSMIATQRCGFYNAVAALQAYWAIAILNLGKGSCTTALAATGGIIMANSTRPAGMLVANANGQIFASNVTEDYGTAISPVQPDETTVQYATTTCSWRGSWRSDSDDVIQGIYSDVGYTTANNWHRGCMWFSLLRQTLSGTTIKSATLTVCRKPNAGSGSAKSLYLCAVSNTSPTGTPSIVANYGVIGSIAWNSTLTFTVPIAAVQGLANGTYGGLCFYENPYNFGSSNWSSGYIRLYGSSTAYKPYLTVVYSDSGAVG